MPDHPGSGESRYGYTCLSMTHTAKTYAQWMQASQMLEQEQPEQCLQLLQSSQNPLPANEIAIKALTLTANAMLAKHEGSSSKADQYLEQAYRLHYPLPAVLLACGWHFKEQQQFQKAHECYSLLACSEPQYLTEFWQGLPLAQQCRYSPQLVQRFLHANPPRLYPLQPIKAALVKYYGIEDAAMLYSAMLRPGKQWTLSSLPLASLQDYARQHAHFYDELIAPRDVLIRAPQVFNGQPPPSIRGQSRSVFLCGLPDIVVSSKSNLLIARDRVLMDYQGDELQRVAINHDADPVVLAADNDILHILDCAEDERRRTIREAMALTGIHSWNYGHWIFEFILPLLACMEKPGFADITLIIDRQMPEQLLELLRFLVGGQQAIMVLAPAESVRVEILWAFSKIAYWPGGEQSGDSISPESELSDTQALARLLEKLHQKLDSITPPVDQPRRIYLKRKDSQKRRLANRQDVENWFSQQGFTLLDFDELSFLEQLRYLRGAEYIIGPDGAAFYGLVFARSGTRIGMLSQPITEGYAWWNQMFNELGQKLLLLPGTLYQLNPYYACQSDTIVDIGLLSAFLEQLRQLPEQTQTPLSIIEVPPLSKHTPRIASNAAKHLHCHQYLPWQACQALEEKKPARALKLLEKQPAKNSLSSKSLKLAAQAIMAAREPDNQKARDYFEALFKAGLPLAFILRECGRFFCHRQPRPVIAYTCFSLLQQLDAGDPANHINYLMQKRKRMYAPAIIRALLHTARPPLYQLQGIRAELNKAWGNLSSLAIYAPVLLNNKPCHINDLPLQSLQHHAIKHGSDFHELIEPREVIMAGPAIFGLPRPASISGHTRSIFFSVIPDITVFSKSNVLLAKDAVLLDYQGDEIHRVPLNPDTNPPVACRNGDLLATIIPAAPGKQLGKGLSLCGLHSYNYGHWIYEFMFPLWFCMQQQGFEDVTLIVDQQMPTQLLEALDFFVGKQHPRLVLSPGESVQVGSLWVCSKISYWPGGEDLSATYLNDYEIADTRALAQLLGSFEPLLERHSFDAFPEKLFLYRNANLGRPFDNRQEVCDLLQSRGFTAMDFGELPFIEQIRHLRAAKVVIVEAGSTLYGGLFCRKGTTIAELSIAEPEGYHWFTEIFDALGHNFMLFPCDSRPIKEGSDQLIKHVDIEKFSDFLDQLG